MEEWREVDKHEQQNSSGSEALSHTQDLQESMNMTDKEESRKIHVLSPHYLGL